MTVIGCCWLIFGSVYCRVTRHDIFTCSARTTLIAMPILLFKGVWIADILMCWCVFHALNTFKCNTVKGRNTYCPVLTCRVQNLITSFST